MNPTEIEFALRDLVSKPYDDETFPYDLIAIYNASKVTVSRLKSGTTNKATQRGDVLWQKQLFFRPAQPGDDVGAVGDALIADPLTARHKPRFILVTNGSQVHIRDLKLEETANVEFERLDEQSYFLLPLAGYERRAIVEEHPADIKAAKKLKKLYDALLAANSAWNTGHHSHELNLLMTRLLFCFYGEKTGIFETSKVFTTTVGQTSEDGSEVAPLLDRLFRVMNVKVEKRTPTLAASERRFPYVNGSLFEDTVEIPQFNRTARRQLLECGDLDWTTINPDIFGSMIQTIAQNGTRSDLGMHYTSVPNIMKVLQPLFLDELDEAYEKAKDSVPKIESLLGRLSTIRVFDPACGSGNFLIIAYKSLRQLEIRILTRIGELSPKMPLRLSVIALHSFYGIDIIDFACETAKLSLWIAEHQMNTAFKAIFGKARPTLPLGRINTIHCKNALRLDWFSICSPSKSSETFICGNPPYHGAKYQAIPERQDLAHVFSPITSTYKELDYVAGWIYKAAAYVSAGSSKASLVTTNSVCQGELVPMLWPHIFDLNVGISHAYASFKWQNNASHNAGVTCVILGLSQMPIASARYYEGEHYIDTPTISPYLLPGASNLIVVKENRPINGAPPMVWGNKPTDGGHLLLSASERAAIIHYYPLAIPLIRRFIGSDEFINSTERYCLFISDEDLKLAKSIPPIANRLNEVRKERLKSKALSTRDYAQFPHRFRQIQDFGKDALIIPTVWSERRKYLTVGLIDKDAIIYASAFALYNPSPSIFSLLSSRLHRIWIDILSGKLESRVRYSSTLVYNTFPIPSLSIDQKRVLGELSKTILIARAKYPAKTIAWLYNPETMPIELSDAHQQNDSYLEEYIYGRTFKDDRQRLEHLFAMYGRLKARASRDGTMFSKQPIAEVI